MSEKKKKNSNKHSIVHLKKLGMKNNIKLYKVKKKKRETLKQNNLKKIKIEKNNKPKIVFLRGQIKLINSIRTTDQENRERKKNLSISKKNERNL